MVTTMIGVCPAVGTMQLLNSDARCSMSPHDSHICAYAITTKLIEAGKAPVR